MGKREMLRMRSDICARKRRTHGDNSLGKTKVQPGDSEIIQTPDCWLNCRMVIRIELKVLTGVVEVLAFW